MDYGRTQRRLDCAHSGGSMNNDHVAEPFRSILEAATLGAPSTPAEIYATIRDNALEDAACAAEAGAVDDWSEYDCGRLDAATAIRALKRPA